jgi:hypothetical protein
MGLFDIICIRESLYKLFQIELYRKGWDFVPNFFVKRGLGWLPKKRSDGLGGLDVEVI